MSSMCVWSCRWCVFVSVVYPVAILSAVSCVIRSLLTFVSDAIGDHMVETHSSIVLPWPCMLQGSFLSASHMPLT